MAIRKTRTKWLVLAGLLAVGGAVLACKVGLINRATAQGEDLYPPPSVIPAPDPAPPPPSPLLKQAQALQRPRSEPVPPPTDPKSALPTPVENHPAKADNSPSLLVPPLSNNETTAKPELGSPPTPSTAPTTQPAPQPPRVTGTGLPLPPLANQAPTAPPSASPTAAPPAPVIAVAPITKIEYRTDPGEPPLAPKPGLVQLYQVKHDGETPREIAQRTLGGTERCDDILKLNPHLKAETSLIEGTKVRLPADACLPADGVEAVKPLPVLRKPVQVKAKVLPLTGTFPCNLDESRTINLPRAIREQLGNCTTIMVSPGPDFCLWVTNQAQLDRLAERLEHSPAREAEVRVFKRLYYAQTEKLTVTAEGRVQVSERLAQFAGLGQEVVLVGIDDHFELWDVNRWKQYTQQKSAARTVVQEGE